MTASPSPSTGPDCYIWSGPERSWGLYEILKDAANLRRTSPFPKLREVRIDDELFSSRLVCIPKGVGKKGRKKIVSKAAQPEPDTRQQGSRTTITAPETIVTERVVLESGEEKMTGTSDHVQPPLHSEDKEPSSSQRKRKKRKTKRQKQQWQQIPLPTYTFPASLLGCPSEVLLLIIGFLRRTEKGTCNSHLFALRQVNRAFRYLLQPILFDSVRVPRPRSKGYDFTKDIRKLLRVIHRNPGLATDIKELRYHEPHAGESILDHDYWEHLNEDCKIFSLFTTELSQRSATFDLSVLPSHKNEISRQYDYICAPLLFSRLTNLRKLSFHGHVGGGYAFLLTPLAKQIWEHMPLKSLEVLDWEPELVYKTDQRSHWPAQEVYDDSEDSDEDSDEEKPANNNWNIISFLRFAPGLQQLSVTRDDFLAIATHRNLPVLQFLTAVSIRTDHPDETTKCLLDLAKCSPVLKTLKIWFWQTCSPEPYNAPEVNQA
ncbi:hypothetical protein BZA77DRAFT_352141 [Pyronema omphalodes]|nr:hypothetical protein BZA77DRAFT_352141 [Pyronema omphalodes]